MLNQTDVEDQLPFMWSSLWAHGQTRRWYVFSVIPQPTSKPQARPAGEFHTLPWFRKTSVSPVACVDNSNLDVPSQVGEWGQLSEGRCEASTWAPAGITSGSTSLTLYSCFRMFKPAIMFQMPFLQSVFNRVQRITTAGCLSSSPSSTTTRGKLASLS